MFTIRQVIYNDNDLIEMNKAIYWAETSIPNRYVWNEIYDTWNYPFTYLFRFVEKADMLLFKLMLNGKQVNT
jgi:hypothetical protein